MKTAALEKLVLLVVALVSLSCTVEKVMRSDEKEMKSKFVPCQIEIIIGAEINDEDEHLCDRE